MNPGVVFPGQGSQSVGMLDGLPEAVVDETLAQADAALGYPLSALIREGPSEELNRTEHTQPAMLAADIAIWRATIGAAGIEPALLAGHSLGEFAALVATGSIDFADALRLVRERARLMQQAVPEGRGGMSAVIGLSEQDLTALCAECPVGLLEPANFNAPGQIVVAGETAALDWLEASARERGAKLIRRLPMSVPSHCSLLADAARAFGEVLSEVEIRPPRWPVLHNLDARPRETAAQIRAALTEQLCRPVQWTRIMEAMAAQVTVVAECGPGNVLCGLARRCAKSLKTVALGAPDGLARLREAMEERS